MFTKQLVDDEKSPLMPLISEAELERQIVALRSNLADDSSAAVQADLMRPEVSELVRLPWWQRMAIFPGQRASRLRTMRGWKSVILVS
jgi:hypothetical protein